MLSLKTIFGPFYWAVTITLTLAAVGLALFYAPVEETMGEVQKIFYLHLPAAICTFLACLLCFVASVGYLLQRRAWWDDLAAAAGRVAVQFCSVVLLTGMIWGHSAWGQWWTWSPRLTFSLVLWLLYVVYLILRASVESAQRRAVLSAAYAVICFLDVPLVYLSTKLMPDIHPSHIQLAPAMQLTLLVWFAPVLMLAAGLVAATFQSHRDNREIVQPSAPAQAQAPAFRWKPMEAS